MCVEAAGRGGWRGYHQEAAAKNLLLRLVVLKHS